MNKADGKAILGNTLELAAIVAVFGYNVVPPFAKDVFVFLLWAVTVLAVVVLAGAFVWDSVYDTFGDAVKKGRTNLSLNFAAIADIIGAGVLFVAGYHVLGVLWAIVNLMALGIMSTKIKEATE